jgi:hypothetical protein
MRLKFSKTSIILIFSLDLNEAYTIWHHAHKLQSKLFDEIDSFFIVGLMIAETNGQHFLYLPDSPITIILKTL